LHRRLIAGNWKMYKNPHETEAFITLLLTRLSPGSNIEVLLIPPYISLDRAGQLLAGSAVTLGAQDLYPGPRGQGLSPVRSRGPYTGAVSAEMIRSCGADYVLVGHSERRHVFGDDDEVVRQKLRIALDVGLAPILCLGETLEQRRAENTESTVTAQLARALEGVAREEMRRVVIAYEPVWAIGTGETATPEQAQEAAQTIRRWLTARFDAESVQETRILYGGSVKPDNTASLVSRDDIDGVLVGGASLDVDAFAQIVREAAL
jgi:triosephosphate isomerase